MKDRRRKIDLNWVIVGILAVIFVVLSLQTNQLMTKQNELSNDLTNVEYLSSSTQRLSKMIIGNNSDDRVIYYIEEQTMQYLGSDSEGRLYVVDDPEVRVIADDIITSWETLCLLFELPEDDEEATYDVDSILLASDNHFDSMTDLSIKITDEKNLLSAEIDQFHLISYGILAGIAFCVLNSFISTSASIRRSRELAAYASLDVATGLYNRSKCQEIFHDTEVTDREKQPAVVVIDLNDLKKTNDTQGHRVGDELIISFANILKESVNIHLVKPFMGRYGGDEFVLYYADVSKEEELQNLAKELSKLTEEFNKEENKKFTISYALGYAINTNGKDGLSVRQLFDEADEKMYENKKEMKKAMLNQENPVNSTDNI